MTDPLCIKINRAWTALPLRSTEEMVVNGEGISISYEALEKSVADQERFGAFRPDPLPTPPEGKILTDRTLGGDERPEWIPTYGDAPEPAVPEVISDRQFAQVLALDGIISQDEALAWAARGDLPQRLTDALTKIPEGGGQRFSARMMLAAATTYERHHPLVPTLGGLLGMDAPALDQIWRTGAAL